MTARKEWTDAQKNWTEQLYQNAVRLTTHEVYDTLLFVPDDRASSIICARVWQIDAHIRRRLDRIGGVVVGR